MLYLGPSNLRGTITVVGPNVPEPAGPAHTFGHFSWTVRYHLLPRVVIELAPINAAPELPTMKGVTQSHFQPILS